MSFKIKKEPSSPPEEIRRLKRNLRIAVGGLTVCVAVIIGLAAAISRQIEQVSFDEHYENTASEKPPHYEQVMAIINPLVYSRIPVLTHPDVTLDVDFEKKGWILRNVFRFDDRGRVVLEQGRYGVCAELVATTMDKIKPLFQGEGYEIKYVRVNESRFYMRPRSVHWVIVIKRPFPDQKVFVLDPSFKKYGERRDFETYTFVTEYDVFPLLRDRNRDLPLPVSMSGAVVTCSKETILSLSLEPLNDRFDRDHFTLALTATRRFKYVGRYVYALTNTPAGTRILENPSLVKRFLQPGEYQGLKRKLNEWMAALTIEEEEEDGGL